jgi:hypothetical protein
VFIKEPIASKFAIIFIIISISLIPSQYLGFSPANAQLNTTDVITNQTTIPQSESNIIKPFTIPRDEPSNSNGLPSTSNSADSNNNSLTQPVNDLVLLSQRYNDERFGDEIVGEILNNGTITAEYAKVSVSFYDENGAILGSQYTYTDPSTIAPGQKAAFNIFITSDTIEDDTETYEFTLQWQDNDFNDFSKRITGEQVQAIDDNDNDNDNDDNNDNNDNDDNNDNNDNDNDDNNDDNNNNKDRNGNALKRLDNLFRK